MTKPAPHSGTKRKCIACAAKFYDLGKRPIVCPKCSTELADGAPIVS